MDTRNNDLAHLNESGEQKERVEFNTTIELPNNIEEAWPELFLDTNLYQNKVLDNNQPVSSEKPSSLKRSYHPEMEGKIRKKRTRLTEGLTELESSIDKETIKFKKNLIKFKNLLPRSPSKRSRSSTTLIDYWNQASQLRDWLAGKDIQCVPVIKPEELIIWFQLILASRNMQVIGGMWKNSTQLQALLFGNTVNFKSDGQEHTYSLSSNKLLSLFESVLASRCPLVIKKMWQNNMQLQALLFGNTVNFKNDGQNYAYSLSSQEIIFLFEKTLSGKCTKIIKGVWGKNKFLYEAIVNLEQCDRDRLIKKCQPLIQNQSEQGKILASRIADTDYLKEEIKQLSQLDNSNGLPGLISISNEKLGEKLFYFRHLLAKRNSEEIIKFWNKNDMLHAWFAGKDVQCVPVITPEELVGWFQSMLTSRCLLVTKEMWKNNTQLQALLFGNTVNFKTDGQDHAYGLSSQEIIFLFEKTLSSLCTKIIKGVWKENKFLYEAIVNLEQCDRDRLIEKCQSLSRYRPTQGKILASKIADTDYLKEEIKRPSQSKTTVDSYYHIENRVENLPPDLTHTSIVDIPSNMDDQDNLIDIPADVIEWINNGKTISSTTMDNDDYEATWANDQALLIEDPITINSNAAISSVFSPGSPTLFAPLSNTNKSMEIQDQIDAEQFKIKVLFG